MAKVTQLPSHRHFTHALLDKKNKVVLDWSAKGGCTLLVHMFFRKMGILEEALSFHPWIHNYRGEYFYKNNGYVTQKILNDPSYYKFKVVRNPYKRAVSSFFFAVNNKNKIFQEFLGDKKIEDSTFRDFIDFLKTVNLDTCNVHFKKQKRLFEKDGFKFNRICKLENIEEEIERVNKDTGLNYIIKKIVNNHHLKRNLELNNIVADRPYLEIRDNLPDYKYFYGKHLVQQIHDLYKDDLEEYGYTFDLGDVGQDPKYSI